MEIWTIGLPSTVALAAVAVIGYLFGQRSRPAPSDQAQLRRELKRARGIIRDLETVAQQVRRDLARHQGSLGKFRSRLKDLTEAGELAEPIDLLASETDKLLEPTQHLTDRLTQAYELIRRQAKQLMSFSEVRTDAQTGLGNRRSLEETLESQLDMHRRYGLVCSLAVFHIDHFKHLRSEQGSDRANQVLGQVGQILDQYARDSDAVFRYGNEEFAVVLPSTGLPGAIAFAERMRSTIERLSPVTVSCGLAEMNVKDQVAGFLTRADAALYSAKSDGRNRVRYDAEQYDAGQKATEVVAIRLTYGSPTLGPAAAISREDATRDTLRRITERLKPGTESRIGKH